MARYSRHQEILGILLIVIGLLFLLVSNDLLWFGWEAVWPIFPFLFGVFLLRFYTARRKPRQLFWGSLFAQLGFFFFLFSSNIFDWDDMSVAWPAFPMMLGVSMLAVSGVIEEAARAVIMGVFFLIVAGVFFLVQSGAIAGRVTWFTRIWPLVLVGAGVLVFLRSRREKLAEATGAETAAKASVTDEPPPPSEVAEKPATPVEPSEETAPAESTGDDATQTKTEPKHKVKRRRATHAKAKVKRTPKAAPKKTTRKPASPKRKRSS
jgi:signal transduction histidine kinase